LPPNAPPDHESEKERQAKLVLRDDTKFASGRIAFFQYFCVAVCLYLVSGFWVLQVQNEEYYWDLAQKNRIRSSPILAPRGKILDRDGRVIVDNHSSFGLNLLRDNLKVENIPTICEGLEVDCDDVLERFRAFDRRNPKHAPFPFKEELHSAQLAFVEAHRGQDTFPEMEIEMRQQRLYPREGLAAHVIGYTGEVSEAELDSAEFARFKQGDTIGKAGIERQYNDLLMGIDGQRRVVVDHRGIEREVIDKKEAVSGKTIRLTIDLDLQAVAELAMENRRGAVVALDPRNGEVLAMVSRPSYDPNKFVGRIRRKDWDEIRNDPANPLLDRTIQAQLAPGSTFKPIVALAGLDTGTVDEGTGVTCTGGETFYGTRHGCHLKKGHGYVSLYRGLTHSCDVYFYTLGSRLGIDKIAEYAEMAGLGRKTGVDLPNEEEGIVPSTRWKIRTLRQRWFAGEVISVAIGQGALTVTPLQLAQAIGGLAMGGVWHKPHLLKDPAPALDPPRKVELDQENLARVIAGMYGVVNDGGTGARSKLPGLEMCGKTGTAQLTSNKLRKAIMENRRKGIPQEILQDNAWFVGFAPRNHPEIAVVALHEAGLHGDRAAPIVRDVIKAYFDKKNRKLAEPGLASPKNPRPGPLAYTRGSVLSSDREGAITGKAGR